MINNSIWGKIIKLEIAFEKTTEMVISIKTGL